VLEIFTGAEDTQAVDQPLATVWELRGNDIEKSLWEKPEVKAIFEQLMDTDPDTRVLIPNNRSIGVRRDILNMVAGQTLPSEVDWWPTASLLMKRFVGELTKGVEAYWMSHWVLACQTILYNNSTIKPSLKNIDCIFLSTEELISLEGIPVLPFTLPEGVWLKKSPTERTMGPDKYSINQEWYWADDYSQFAYNLATA
jgi:hypothetical protein